MVDKEREKVGKDLAAAVARRLKASGWDATSKVDSIVCSALRVQDSSAFKQNLIP